MSFVYVTVFATQDVLQLGGLGGMLPREKLRISADFWNPV